MGRTLAEILWQLERKRKYCWSCGTNRTTTCALAKAVTLVLFLFLVYFSLSSVLLDSNSELDYPDQVLGVPAVPLPANAGYRGSLMNRNYYDGFRNNSNFNVQNFMDATNESGSGSDNGDEVKPAHIKRLTLIFHKADRDRDGYIDGSELTTWINEGVKAHFSHALKDNFDKYFLIDKNPRNGLVTWDEYLFYFFKTQGITGITANDIHNRTSAFKALSRETKVEIARLQASWSEAASNSPEFLTVDEFLAFEHPEASPTQILYQVQDTFSTFDLDGDGTISEKEFETTYREAEGVDIVYKNDKQIIDTDKNGQITRVELMRYMDPRGLHHSEKDAKALLKVADSGKDGRLSLSEVLQNAKSVIKSKFYDVEKNLHNQD